MSTTIDSLAPARSPLAGLSASPKFLSQLPKSLKSIAVSVAPGDSTEVRRYGILGGRHDDVLKLAKKLQAAHPGAALKFCYEAGPRGYSLAASCAPTATTASSSVPRASRAGRATARAARE